MSQGLLLRETVARQMPKAHGFIRKNGDHAAAKAICTRLQTASSEHEHDDLCIFIGGNLLFETR